MLYESKKQIMLIPEGDIVPEYTFDTDLTANKDQMVWTHYFEDGTRNTRYIDRCFQPCLIYHIHHIEEKNPDRLQRLVDSGKLYDYLIDLYNRVEDAVTDQKDLWVKNDEKYKEIVKNDPVGAAGIVNMYEMQAREVIYQAMIYD